MRRVQFVCNICGYRQVVELFSPEEARHFGLALGLPTCENCGPYDMKMIS